MSKNKKPAKNTLFKPFPIAVALRKALHKDLLGEPRASSSSLLYEDLEDPQSPSAFYAIKQTSSFLKKFVEPSIKSQPKQHDVALEDFRENCDRLNQFSGIVFPTYPESGFVGPIAPLDLILLRARNLCHELLGVLDVESWFNKVKHGNGSTVGCTYVDTSIEAKSTLPLTCTENCSPILINYLTWDIQYQAALYKLAKENPYVSFKRLKNPQTRMAEVIKIVKGSKLTTIEKTIAERRTISPEPTGNMMLQLGLMEEMYDLMRAFNLDVDNLQQIHQIWAFLGSMFPELISTLDLKKASDSVLVLLMIFLFPEDWSKAIMSIRSPFTHYVRKPKGKPEEVVWIELPMVGTMGNATTFPIETIIFYAITTAVTSVAKTYGPSLLVEYEDKNLVSVFGDDIICGTQVAEDVISVLECLGFLVNKEKSFFAEDVYFRESCGSDYLMGHNVRPFHLKWPTSKKVSSLAPWLYIVSNRLFQKYTTYFGDETAFWSSAVFSEICSLFIEYKIPWYFVPGDFPDDSGFRVQHSSQYLACSKVLYERDVPVAPVETDIHCTTRFPFKSFVYTDSAKKFGHIRLWDVFKKNNPAREIDRLAYLGEKEIESIRVVKRKGGYVVRTGVSGKCPWQVPWLPDADIINLLILEISSL